MRGEVWWGEFMLQKGERVRGLGSEFARAPRVCTHGLACSQGPNRSSKEVIKVCVWGSVGRLAVPAKE